MAVTHFRIRQDAPVYRRVFSAAAIGLANWLAAGGLPSRLHVVVPATGPGVGVLAWTGAAIGFAVLATGGEHPAGRRRRQREQAGGDHTR
jgi:hypothetical protein